MRDAAENHEAGDTGQHHTPQAGWGHVRVAFSEGVIRLMDKNNLQNPRKVGSFFHHFCGFIDGNYKFCLKKAKNHEVVLGVSFFEANVWIISYKL